MLVDSSCVSRHITFPKKQCRTVIMQRTYFENYCDLVAFFIKNGSFYIISNAAYTSLLKVCWKQTSLFRIHTIVLVVRIQSQYNVHLKLGIFYLFIYSFLFIFIAKICSEMKMQIKTNFYTFFSTPHWCRLFMCRFCTVRMNVCMYVFPYRCCIFHEVFFSWLAKYADRRAFTKTPHR